MKNNLLKNTKGTTILEVIVTVMVLSIALTILASGFYTVYNLTAEANKYQDSIDRQILALQGEEVDIVKVEDKKDQEVTIRSDGSTYKFKMDTRETWDLSNDAFILKGQLKGDKVVSSLELTMYQNYKSLFPILMNLTSTERKELGKELGLGIKPDGTGTPTDFWPTNDNFMRYLYKKVYNQTWPIFDNALLPKGENADIYTKTYYIRITAKNGTFNSDADLIIYAQEGLGVGVGTWGCTPFLMYDYGDGKDPSTATGWYYRRNGAHAPFVLGELSWDTFRSKYLLPQSDGWKKLGN